MKISRSHTTPQFESDFLELPAKIKSKSERKIKLFEDNCFNGVLDTHKLHGVLKEFWSFSIDGTHRVIFKFLPDKEVIYYRIGTHDIYEKLEHLF